MRTKATLRVISSLLRGHRRALVVLIVLALAGTLAEACLPIGLGQVVNGIERGRFDIVLVASGVLALVVVARVASSVVAHAVGRNAEIDVAITHKQQVGAHLVRHRSVIGEEIQLGDAVETAETDTDTIAGVVGVTRSLVVSTLTFVAISVYLITNSWIIGGAIVVGASCIALFLPALVGVLEQPLEEHRARSGAVAGLAADAASGLRDLRGIGAEDVFLQRFHDASAAMRAAGLRVARRRALISGVQVAIPSAFVLVILGIALWQFRTGEQSAGDLVTYYGLGVFLVGPVGSFVAAWNEIPAVAVAVRRERALLDAGTAPRSGRDGTPEGMLLDEASGLVVHPGEFVVVTGGRPAALRSLAARLVGDEDVPSVSVGKTTWAVWDERAARRHAVLLDSDARLVSGSVREIIGAQDDDHARAVLRAAAADEFVGSDLEREISEGGRDLSGGQVRRLLLAQALAVDSEILVLVEPTRSLDLVTEHRVVDRLARHRAGRTTVVCTQTPVAFGVADRVVTVSTPSSDSDGSWRVEQGSVALIEQEHRS
ncbi:MULTISPECIES: ABC transporter ATP-binding protein [unclassified Curtobacterium]|uniref:ABC transporter transmembrane domain-containing protein n=1 Tax=unclassified Curtobacterium TaxID=257496 RepID=UPI0009F30B9A|nr:MULTISPECIES: ABC transporter ATP-binding protein [unclassified Curtobacterium]WIB00405.1 ABC transporter ATP-binding protein [Curtobacterium sp. MCBA15_012]